MSVARPLSTGRIVISVSSFREWRGCLCLFERLSSGGDAFWSTKLVLALMLLASAIGGFFNTVSTLATMSFVGIVFGVTENFRPFSRRSFSWGDNVLVERLTSHLDLSIVIWFWSSATCLCWSCVERVVYFFKWRSFVTAISLE